MERLAASEKEFSSKLRMKKIEFKLKRKSSRWRCKYSKTRVHSTWSTKKGLEVKGSDSDDDGAGPSIRSWRTMPFSWRRQEAKRCRPGWTDQISLIGYTPSTILELRRTTYTLGSRLIASGCTSQDHQAESNTVLFTVNTKPAVAVNCP